MRLTVSQLAERIEAELVGAGSASIDSVEGIEAAGINAVTFVVDERHLAKLGKSGAGAVIVSRRLEGLPMPQLIVRDVNRAVIEALKIFAPELKKMAEGIDPTAKIGRDVRIGSGVYVGAYVIIDDNVEIGSRSAIASGCRVGENSKIGEDTRIDSNVVIYHNCRIGSNVVIQANCTIGSTGFGYYLIDGAHRLVPHNGGVIIEDFVEIGANSCVDRAKFGNTVIGAGTKIDNLVQIAHNVVIGKCCLIVAQVGISGSCRLGDGVVLGGQVGLADNIKLGDGTMVAGRAGVTGDSAPGQKLFGFPAIDRVDGLRAAAAWKRLPKLVEQIRQLGARIGRLEAAKDDKD